MSPFMLDRRCYNCGALYRGTSTKQTLLFVIMLKFFVSANQTQLFRNNVTI
jgi:hypothetical protein